MAENKDTPIKISAKNLFVGFVVNLKIIYVNLKYPRNLGIFGSRDRLITGLFPQSPSKRNAPGLKF